MNSKQDNNDMKRWQNLFSGNKLIPIHTCCTLFITLLLASCTNGQDKTTIQTLTFSSCSIEYPVYENGGKFLYEGHSIPNEMEYESARRKLAICLCEDYMKHPSDSVKSMILDIYHSREQYFHIDTTTSIEFDSIVSKRNTIFDPTILID